MKLILGLLLLLLFLIVGICKGIRSQLHMQRLRMEHDTTCSCEHQAESSEEFKSPDLRDV